MKRRSFMQLIAALPLFQYATKAVAGFRGQAGVMLDELAFIPTRELNEITWSYPGMDKPKYVEVWLYEERWGDDNPHPPRRMRVSETHQYTFMHAVYGESYYINPRLDALVLVRGVYEDADGNSFLWLPWTKRKVNKTVAELHAYWENELALRRA
jgi:hypothetical protein